MTKEISRKDIEFILDSASECFSYLDGKNIFLTGGTGFFGKWLLESFKAANEISTSRFNVTVLTREPEKFKLDYPHLAEASQISLIKGDVRSFDFLQERFDLVIHAATDVNITNSNKNTRKEILDVIVAGTRNILEFSQKSNCKRFLYISSGAVYGDLSGLSNGVDEDYLEKLDRNNLLSAYGEGKRSAEELGSLFCKKHEIDFLVARCFSFIGPHMPMDGTNAAGDFFRDAINRKDIVIKGDGLQVRSYLYMAELVIFLLQILKNGKPDRPYNVGSDEALSLKELAKRISFTLDNNINVIVKNKVSVGLSGNIYYPDINRIRNELGLIPKVSLEEAISRTVEWSLPST